MPGDIIFKAITKRFPGVLANDSITLTIRAKTVHAIVGENGAGKSTLMNILCGLLQPDSGEILIDHQYKSFNSPRDAVKAGIGMVHQEFMLARDLTVLDNLILGYEPGSYGLIKREEARKKLQKLSAAYGLSVPLDCKIGEIPVSFQQQVEILKVLYRGAEIIIFDEPTAVLTPQETRGLFTAIRELIEQNKTVIFISHKLKEVIAIADRISILRNGRVSGELPVEEATEQRLAELMVGRKNFLQAVPPVIKEKRAPLLEIVNLRVTDQAKIVRINDLSFSIQAGEILGVAGVAGNGQSELVAAIIGWGVIDSGRILLNRIDITTSSVRQRRLKGMRYIPQDRSMIGSCLSAAVWENLIMGYEFKAPLARRGLLNFTEINSFSKKLIGRFKIKVASQDMPVQNLSGGNLQKTVIARELAENSTVLLAEDPTRGVDIAAAEFIHTQILQEAGKGSAVLLISQDLDELLSLSNRIIVLYDGGIIGESIAGEMTKETIGLLMGGRCNGKDGVDK